MKFTDRYLFCSKSILVVALALFTAVAAIAQTATGFVFDDRNRNGVMDAGERGIPRVMVSNMRDIVRTDSQGRYRVEAGEESIIFVIKPRNWAFPLDADNYPRFYYIHKPQGSPKQRFEGVAPTGPLPSQIDFPLYRSQEPNQFEVIFFGDTQPYNDNHLNWTVQDAISEVVGTNAAFGITLGDVVGDNLDLLPPIKAAKGRIGVPWLYTVGNHDLNFDSPDDSRSTETWKRIFGTTYFAYQYGPVMFVNLDNIKWEGGRRYSSWLGPDQMTFVRNLLSMVPKDQLLVFMMHIPLMELEEKEEFLAMMKDHPNTVSLSAHYHTVFHRFFGAEDGWKQEQPHHHFNVGAVSGSWWGGELTYLGIPHTLMRDGSPRGYVIGEFDGNRYRMRYKATGLDSATQMHLWIPHRIPSGELKDAYAWANVFAASPKCRVEARFNGGQWSAMVARQQQDPFYVAIKKLEEEKVLPASGRALPRAENSEHLYWAKVPNRLEPGYHTLEVRWRDLYGREHTSTRVFRVDP